MRLWRIKVADTKPRAISRRRKTFAGLAAAGIVAALAVTAAALPSSASTQARSRIPASAIARINTTALAIAKYSGDKTPISIMAVTTSHANALRAATPGDRVPVGANQPVYLVVMRGRFIYKGPQPPGAHVSTENYLSLTLNPATFQVLDIGLSKVAPPVSLHSFGQVTKLAT
jgi:hypothetical protein